MKETDPSKVAASLRGKLRDANRELTRLRSELQQKRDRIMLLQQTLIARFYNEPSFNKDSLSKIIDEVEDLLK